MDLDEEREILRETRARSYRLMQIAFSFLSLAAIAAGLAVHCFAPELGLTEEQPTAIANSFLFMGAAYMLTLFVWDSFMKPGS